MGSFPLAPRPASRAWYDASISEFENATSESIVGRITSNSQFAVLPEQRDAWLAEIHLLQECLRDLTGTVFLEFSIPRMGSRIDAVLLIGSIIFVVEFKIGEVNFDRGAVDQVWDYALDLKYFHEASHALPVVPILVATGATKSPPPVPYADEDKLYRPIRVHTGNLRPLVDLMLQTVQGQKVDAEYWAQAPYRPTPTIIEAARALYSSHSVDAIARSDAGARNLRITSTRIEQLVDDARTRGRKVICFVTGVPVVSYLRCTGLAGYVNHSDRDHT